MKAVFLTLAAVFATAALGAEPMPSLSGDLAIHDPSVIASSVGWASFATGIENAADGGMPQTKTSPDGLVWRDAGAIPGGQPAWIAAQLGMTPRNIWAPSISRHGDFAFLYYAASSFGSNNSVIGLAINARFDPTQPAMGWVDRGMVLRSRAGDNFNAIDPFRVDTSDGKAWLIFGSFWDGIRLVELDPTSGLVRDGAPMVRIASRQGGPIEAPSILEHEGRFYLFVSFDFCCRGIASTYRIMVGRADAIAGPYLDREGHPMLAGGGTELLAGSGRYRGPGGAEAFDANGTTWLAFHYYDAGAGGAPKLQVAPLGWSADGWPELGPLPPG